MAATPKPASEPIVRQHKALLGQLPFADTQDFDDATRGLVARREPNAVTDADGTVLWDNDTYAFLDGEAPDTVNPSLWRQSRLAAIDGLFEVVPGIYQVRGLDLSNTSFIEGDAGVVVVDTLLSAETGAAALELYRRHRGDRPVKAIIYTHSHADHFGGVKGFVSQREVDDGAVRIFAPEGFIEHSVSENVYAGTAMNRRAAYMYGAALARGPQGQVGAGLGQTISTGTVSLIAPTDFITTTGHEETVDGVRMIFQMAPDTEAPSEMLVYFPDHRALCAAEDATHTFHNLLTLRGAVVRDPHGWAGYITETIDLFGGDAEVVFAAVDTELALAAGTLTGTEGSEIPTATGQSDFDCYLAVESATARLAYGDVAEAERRLRTAIASHRHRTQGVAAAAFRAHHAADRRRPGSLDQYGQNTSARYLRQTRHQLTRESHGRGPPQRPAVKSPPNSPAPDEAAARVGAHTSTKAESGPPAGARTAPCQESEVGDRCRRDTNS
ncbi:alkyl/aryl-sulfatase [Nocardia sp. NBC_01503]|uniref:alkyl/aryl-sulfatase n=1 Tax=Nocardia sp. NBC_01503 TaxID=2975997 RepID=UPI003FA538CC